MMIFWVILSAVVIYCFLVFIASRFLVPFMDWGGFKPATQVPDGIKAAIAELEARAINQRSYLEAVYDLVMQKNRSQWHHTRLRVLLNLPRAWVTELSEIWETHDFIYCTGMNYLVAALLVDSKYFKAEDIRVRHTFVNFFIHQYLQVNVRGSSWVDVDPAGSGIRGKPLGTHLEWFG